uniref:Integrase catalytic domain-containing protein n=1 Tax=Heterorhabditis bacteriophora TaxID=37862 RepID=A0A1I7WG78_HETBA
MEMHRIGQDSTNCAWGQGPLSHVVNYVDRLEAVLLQMENHGLPTNSEDIMITIEKSLPPWIETQLIPIKVADPTIDVSRLRKHLRLILDGTSERSVRMWMSSGPQERITTMPMTTDGQKQRNFHISNETHTMIAQITRYTKDRSRYRKCPFCDKPQRRRECPVYETAQKRIARTRELGRCLNCLGEHYVRNCKSKSNCINCGNRHNTSLCSVSTRSTTYAPVITQSDETEIITSALAHTGSGTHEPTVALMTTEVEVVNPVTGQKVTALAFFDTGSQVSLITDKLASALGLQGISRKLMTISGFNGNLSHIPYHNCSVGIINTNGEIRKINVRRVPTIVRSLQTVRIPKDIPTPTSVIHETRAPSLIIGNDLFWTFVSRRCNRFVEGYQLVSSSVGPLLSGFVSQPTSHAAPTCTQVMIALTDKEVNRQIHDWLEDPSETENDTAWSRFKETCRFENGRYSVSLPIRDPNALTPTNEGLAIRKLLQMKKDLDNNPNNQVEVRHIMDEWINEGVIEEVPSSELKNPLFGYCSYLPYHVVTKRTPNGIKYSIVHNASARMKNSSSLNDMLFKGPLTLPNVLGILIRFRQHRIRTSKNHYILRKVTCHTAIHTKTTNGDLIIWFSVQLHFDKSESCRYCYARPQHFEIAELNSLVARAPFLQEQKSEWPDTLENPQLHPVRFTPIPIVPPTTLVPSMEVSPDPQRFSTWDKLINILVTIIKFALRVSRKSKTTLHGRLLVPLWNIPENSTRIREQANKIALFHMQLRTPPTAKELTDLRLYPDHEGLLRSVGRLGHSNLLENTKNPVFIPRRDPATQLLILDTHCRHHHLSKTHTLNELRSRFWIPAGQATVRQTLSRCIACKRHKEKPFMLPPIPSLSPARLQINTPLTNVDIDYAGPFHVWTITRSCNEGMDQIATNLSSKEFLRAVRRLVARRGRPSLIINDNGTNFKGAACTRIVGNALLTLEEFSTLLTETEAIVNTRPLIYVDNEDIALRPIDFLTPYALPGIPITDNTNMFSHLSDAWTSIKQRLNNLWECFRREYLTSLRERSSKGLHQPRGCIRRPPQVGEVILVDEPNIKRGRWRLARIIQTMPSQDHVVRTVEVQFANGSRNRRSIATVYLLEICSTDRSTKDRPFREYTTETQTQSELDHTTETNTKPQEVENTESAPLTPRNTVQSGEPRNTTRYDLRTNQRLKKFEFFTLLA